jgi:hypothetical protein
MHPNCAMTASITFATLIAVVALRW